MNNNSSIAVPQSGMNRDKHPSSLQENEYSFAMNACIENETGDALMLQNEPSNLLCKRFEGYKVIGYKNDLSDNTTYFFLVNPSNKTSKIVFLQSVDYIANEGEIQYGGSLNSVITLSEPIESQAGRYMEICDQYQVLIEDNEDDPCLKFSLAHPVYDIEIKQEKCGKCIYWTDGFNPQRYVIIEKALEPDEDGDIWYHYHGYKLCGDNTPIIKCVLACEKLRVFPLLQVPMIKAEIVEFGGSLRAGVYQFCVALCDEFGNEKSGYSLLTNPVSIFDKQNVTVTDGLWGKTTNLGIRLAVENIDRQASHFKVGVIQNTVGYNGEEQIVNDFFIEGIHPVTESAVYYYSDINNKRTTFEHLSMRPPVYNTADGMTSVGNRLLHYGLTAEPEWNLQPVCNLLGHFIKWQTSVSTENLYKDGRSCSLYTGYMRDEVYPLGIRFFTTTGFKTSLFPLIPRPKSKEEAEIVDESSVEYQSININAPLCVDIPRKEKWQYYNTAKELGKFGQSLDRSEECIDLENCKNKVMLSQSRVYDKEFHTEGAVELRFEPNVITSDIVDYVELNIEEIIENPTTPSADSMNMAWFGWGAGTGEKNDTTVPDGVTFPCNCTGVRQQDDKILTAPKEYIENPDYDFIYKTLDEMDHVRTSGLETSRAEADNKYEYMFNMDLSEELQEKIEQIYSCDDGELIPDRPAEKILNKLAEARKMYMISECLYGCSVKLPYENPTISEDRISGLFFQRTPICSFLHFAGPSKTSDGSDHILSDNIKAMDRDFNTLLTKFDDCVRPYLLLDFPVSIKTQEWERRVFDQNDVEGMGENTNFRFESGISRFKFYPYLHSDTRWIKITRPSIWDLSETKQADKFLILEALGNSQISVGDSTSYPYVRITFWYKDAHGDFKLFPNKLPLPDDAIASNRYSMIVKYRERFFSKLTEESFIDETGQRVENIYISIDTAICVMYWLFIERKGSDRCIGSKGWGYSVCTSITPSSYGIGIRDKEIKEVVFTADSMKLLSTTNYVSDCYSCGDTPIDCDPRPYAYGDFSYWESSEKYPANFELFDSTRVKFNARDGKYADIVKELSKYYGVPKSTKEGSYFDGHTANYPDATTVFCQKPIRHYKFPDNFIAPFMNDAIKSNNTLSDVYVLGFMLDDDIINKFLDIAVESGLISQDKRDQICGYELYRGDRKLNKSIIANGLAYDMWKYVDQSGQINLYSNYPYNDLNRDEFIYNDASRSTPMTYPFSERGNVWYSFCSPDLYFNKPDIPNEVKIEGYQRGYSSGAFVEVENHPKWTVLGPKAYQMARTLATIEAAGQLAIEIMNATAGAAQQMYVGGGLVFFANPAGIAMTTVKMISAIAKATSKAATYRGKYRYDWLTIYMNNGPRYNYAYYYTSEGFYNSMYIPMESERKNNSLRGVSKSAMMRDGKTAITDSSSKYFENEEKVKSDTLLVNNEKRENSLFMSFGYNPNNNTLFKLRYPTNIRYYDSSRITDAVIKANDSVAGNTSDFIVQSSSLASPYMKLKKHIINQYGRLEDVKWMSMGPDKHDLDGTSKFGIFGGDTYISRFSLKRKFPMFFIDAFKIGDMIPFPYNDYRNVGYPKYFINFDTGEERLDVNDSESGTLFQFPTRKSIYKLNGVDGDMYIKGRMYLYFYGIPQFLVESDINCNFRLEGTQLHEKFYPNVGSYVRWTQEKNVSIDKDNDYRINGVYNRRQTLVPMLLPSTYEKKFWDCAYQRPNGVIWSVEDISENGMTDPWLSYKPMDYFEFPSKYGKLISMKGIESDQVLSRFENQVRLDNAIDVLKERLTPENQELGTGGLFASRGLEYNSTDLGYSGTQSRDIVSNEFGHFWADIKRGQVFMVNPNGQGLKELSSGIKYWLKEHLPMKLLRYNIPNINTGNGITYMDVDNKFLSLGLSLGWDNRFKRLFITKKDYIPTRQVGYKFKDGEFYYNDQKVSVHDTEYFKDVSFTVAFKCDKGDWISYYSFIPDYYIEHLYYFQTGINFDKDSNKEGLWSHLLTNQSYQTFYGEKYDFTVEVPVKEQFVNKILAAVQYRMEARKYHNEIDYTVNRLAGFDKAWLYNNRDCSGELRLVVGDKNNMAQKLAYPRYYGNYSEIIAENVDDKWKINDFFNRTADDINGIPIWLKDTVDIDRVINENAMNYQTIWQDRLRGDWMLFRLSNTQLSTYKLIVRWMSSDEKVYNA